MLIHSVEAKMLVLLRSDFRANATREAFYRLLRYAHIKSDYVFEVPAMQAPTPNAIVIRLRKLQPAHGMVLVVGTCKHESLEQSLDVLAEVRKHIPYLEIIHTIILARESEWKHYEQAQTGVECFEVPERRALVVVQRDSYENLAQRTTLAYLLPRNLAGDADNTRAGGDATTQQFMLGDQPSSSLPRITDKMLLEAGINPREDEPTAEFPVEVPIKAGKK